VAENACELVIKRVAQCEARLKDGVTAGQKSEIIDLEHISSLFGRF
jgi:hypothetical protein